MKAKKDTAAPRNGLKLEIVLKCDSAGSMEAVTAAIQKITVSGIDISILHSGIGAISKSDVLLAETGSKLIAGFQVGTLPALNKVLKEHGVEVRLYEVIYRLTEDLREIAEGFIPPPVLEQIIGSGKVIALFKSERKGIIIGCEVLDGFLAEGQHFRIISAMGPVYSGIIESLHIGDRVVQKASSGQKAGIKIKDFNKAKVGDIIESFRFNPREKTNIWQPNGRIIQVPT